MAIHAFFLNISTQHNAEKGSEYMDCHVASLLAMTVFIILVLNPIFNIQLNKPMNQEVGHPS